MVARSKSVIVDIDRVTGEYTSGFPRVAQSIETILKTRIGTRVERLWWGSNFTDLMDKPQIQEVFAASIVDACRYIDLYEPEFYVSKIAITPSYDGTAEIIVYGDYLPDQTSQTISVRMYGSTIRTNISPL